MSSGYIRGSRKIPITTDWYCSKCGRHNTILQSLIICGEAPPGLIDDEQVRLKNLDHQIRRNTVLVIGKLQKEKFSCINLNNQCEKCGNKELWASYWHLPKIWLTVANLFYVFALFPCLMLYATGHIKEIFIIAAVYFGIILPFPITVFVRKYIINQRIKHVEAFHKPVVTFISTPWFESLVKENELKGTRTVILNGTCKEYTDYLAKNASGTKKTVV